MFTAYHDESGTPDQSALVVAGFLASDAQWSEFERNWTDTLRYFGVAQFHAKEFFHSVGEFSKWKDHHNNNGLKTDRQRFLGQLLAHIKLRTRLLYSHSVCMKDYRRVDEIYFLRALRPYALCGRTSAVSVANWAARNRIPESQVTYVFEDGAKDKGFLLKRLLKDKGIKVILKKKNEAVPLQAADLLAYESLAGIRDIFERGVRDFDKLRYPFRRMLEEVPHQPRDWATYSEEDLMTLCANIGLPRRDSIDEKDFVGMSRKEIIQKLVQIWSLPRITDPKTYGGNH